MPVPAVGLFSRVRGRADREEDLSPDELVAKAGNMRFRGKLDKALRYCNQALLAEPGNEAVLAEKAQVLTEMGRYQDAMELFDRVMVQDSAYASDPIMQRGKYTALINLGRVDEALESCNKTLELISLRRAASASGKGNEIGLGVFREYNHQVLREKVIILGRLGRHGEVLECCEEALAEAPGDLQTLNYRGHALYNLGRYEEAFEVTEAAIDLDPTYLPIFLLRSLALHGLGKKERALDIVKEVLKIEPDNLDALQVRDRIRGDAG
ncbi:MAG: tetratricopeptide repeat protein [Gammaproteobacteria bacterium]|nr:tetratricopeptide repeat protein [Gammaproteobacteria bacterium]